MALALLTSNYSRSHRCVDWSTCERNVRGEYAELTERVDEADDQLGELDRHWDIDFEDEDIQAIADRLGIELES